MVGTNNSARPEHVSASQVVLVEHPGEREPYKGKEGYIHDYAGEEYFCSMELQTRQRSRYTHRSEQATAVVTYPELRRQTRNGRGSAAHVRGASWSSLPMVYIVISAGNLLNGSE